MLDRMLKYSFVSTFFFFFLFFSFFFQYSHKLYVSRFNIFIQDFEKFEKFEKFKKCEPTNKR